MLCELNNRPNSSSCSETDYNYVCGYYTEGCPKEMCGETYKNSCQACSDSRILFYNEDDCQPGDKLMECGDEERTCDPGYYPGWLTKFEPVCGYTLEKDCTTERCSQTFSNLCLACSAGNYSQYTEGTCEEDKIYCLNGDEAGASITNSTETESVCAYFESEVIGDEFTTVASGYHACMDPSVLWYTRGVCQKPEPGPSYCLPRTRPMNCTQEDEPVCGFYYDETGEEKQKEITNACFACNDSEIVYYEPGPCVLRCDYSGGTSYECDGGVVEPICGTYRKNGTAYNVSLKNSCTGCYNSGFRLDSYTQGLCPGDEGVRCQYDSSGYEWGRMSPVCGAIKENCASKSCMRTFGDPVSACRGKGVVLWRPGTCPGDEGVPCTMFRTDHFLDYQIVCGYTKVGCKSYRCRRTFANQYEACKHRAILFFKDKRCPPNGQ